MGAVRLLLHALGLAAAAYVEPGTADLAALVRRFWAAPDVATRDAVAAEIVASGASFEAVAAELPHGRAYSADVPRGRLLRERAGIDGLRHPYMILAPEDYDPARTWPVRLDLHGGMGADEWEELDGSWSPGWGEVRGAFVVCPAGWWDSMWWEWSQVESIEAILRELRATWNVDEDRVVAYGASDGGAALFFLAMRRPDRFSGYAGHVAPPDRLVRADFRPDGQMHVSNLAGQRFLLGYGEKDTKVPLRFVERYMELFQAAGASIDWYVLPGQGHSLALPPEREQELAQYQWGIRRDPLPDTLSWATERTDRYARRSWLVIDELAPPEPGAKVDESNLLPRWGTSIQLRGPTAPRVPWGRVELVREGNRVTATTRSVARFRLLLSPDELDFAEPVVVTVDGEVRFEGRVEPSVATLLWWAARDDDRSVRFGAELAIE